LCHAARSTLSKAVQTDDVVAINESDVNFANRRRGRTRHYFSHDGAADNTGIFAALIIFQRDLNPTLSHQWSPFARTR
jgi:hypothetical protein